MIPAPDDTLEHIIESISHTRGATDIASKHKDRRFTDQHRTWFSTKFTALDTILVGLETHESTLRNRERHEGTTLQLAVEFADDTTDSDFAHVVKVTKPEVEGKAGVPPERVFGQRIADVIDLPMRVEVIEVRAAADRMDVLAPFDQRDALKKLLLDSAEQEEAALDARDVGDRATNTLQIEAAKAKLDAVVFLNRFAGELQEKFPRQRKLHALFFLKGPKRKKKKAEPDPMPKG